MKTGIEIIADYHSQKHDLDQHVELDEMIDVEFAKGTSELRGELQSHKELIEQYKKCVDSSNEALAAGNNLIEELKKELWLAKESVDRERFVMQNMHHDLIEIGLALDKVGVPRKKKIILEAM